MQKIWTVAIKSIQLIQRRSGWVHRPESAQGLMRITRVGWDKGTIVQQEKNPYPTLRYVMEGDMRWVGQPTSDITSGHWLAHPAGSDYDLRPRRPTHLFNLAFTSPQANWEGLPHQPLRGAESQPDETRHLLQALLLHLEAQPSTDSGIVTSYLHLILHRARRSFAQPQSNDPRLESISRALGQDLHLPINVEVIAEEHNMDRSTLYRIFRQGRGISPSAFRQQKRLELASSLLSDSPSSIQAISTRCGYACPFAFSKAFRKAMGLSPSAFRHREANLS